jgi:hypothetical protein
MNQVEIGMFTEQRDLSSLHTHRHELVQVPPLAVLGLAQKTVWVELVRFLPQRRVAMQTTECAQQTTQQYINMATILAHKNRTINLQDKLSHLSRGRAIIQHEHEIPNARQNTNPKSNQSQTDTENIENTRNTNRQDAQGGHDDDRVARYMNRTPALDANCVRLRRAACGDGRRRPQAQRLEEHRLCGGGGGGGSTQMARQQDEKFITIKRQQDMAYITNIKRQQDARYITNIDILGALYMKWDGKTMKVRYARNANMHHC